MKLRVTFTIWLCLLVCCPSLAISEPLRQDSKGPQPDKIGTISTSRSPQPQASEGVPAKVGAEAMQGGHGGIITVKIEGSSEKDHDSGWPETLKSISELVGAIAWPAVFVVLLLTQRRELTRLLASLVEAIGKSTRLKLGEVIDLEVDRSAKKAEESPIPQTDIPAEQREAATRVVELVGDSELSVVRERMLAFAHEYEAIRSDLKPGRERTRAMDATVAKMRTLALAAKPLLPGFAGDPVSPGKRLAAIAILQLSPSLDYVQWLVGRMSEEQPFVFFHASLALLATVRAFGAHSSALLKSALEEAMRIVTSFKGGAPDRNTVETLKAAISELSSQMADPNSSIS